MLFKKWWENAITNKGKLNSLYDRVNKFETDYNKQLLELKRSESLYKKLYREKSVNVTVLKALIEISSAISNGHLCEVHAGKTAAIIQKAFNITEVYYAEIKNNAFRKIKSYVCEELIGTYIPVMEGTTDDLPEFIEYGTLGLCHKVDNNEFSTEEAKYYSKIGIRSCYSCPVILDGVPIGAVGFNKTEPCVWSEEEISIGQIFSSLISMYLNRVNLIEGLKKANEEQLRQCDLVTSTMSMVNGFIWNKDETGKYRFCSPNFKRLFFGLPEEIDINGKTDMELLDDFRNRTGLVHTYGNICFGTDGHCREQGTACYYIEFGYIGNSLFALDVVKTPQYDKDGNYTGVVGIARDRSKDLDILDMMLSEYVKDGLAINLNQSRMFIDRVTAYWIKSESDHTKLLRESTIIPR